MMIMKKRLDLKEVPCALLPADTSTSSLETDLENVDSEGFALEERKNPWGSLGGSAVEHLPSAQSKILESWDQVPHPAPCMEPAFPSACVSASLSPALCVCVCVCVMNK